MCSADFSVGSFGKKYGTWLSVCITVWCLRIRYFALTPTVFLISPVNAKNLMSLLGRVAEWLWAMLAQLTWDGITWVLELPGYWWMYHQGGKVVWADTILWRYLLVILCLGVGSESLWGAQKGFLELCLGLRWLGKRAMPRYSSGSTSGGEFHSLMFVLSLSSRGFLITEFLILSFVSL